MATALTPIAGTGIAGLDDILRGGFPRRRIHLIQGDPGVGKTTMGLQFLLEGVKQGERGLYVTLSETEEELRGVATSHGWSLDGIAIHQLLSPEEQQEAQRQNTLFHPSEVELNETIKRVLALVEEANPTRVIFDSLSEMRLLAGDSLKYRRQILSLKQHFAGRNSTVVFLEDGTVRDGDLQLQSLAHGVIALEKLAPTYGTTRRRLEIIKMRGVDFRGGKHDYTIEHDGLNVFPRLVAAEHQKPHKRETLKSGVDGLDSLLGGGLSRGNSALFLGPAGVGKSTVASLYMHAALKRHEKVALFCFDESVATFLDRTSSTGLDFQGFVERGELLIQKIDPAEMSAGQFVHAVRRAVEVHNCQMVVFDSLNGFLMAMPDEKFLVIQLHELLAYLGHRGVTTLMVVAQHGIVGQMQTPVDVTYLADTVMLFRFFEAGGCVRKAVSVMKKRIGHHEDAIREFQITSSGVHVGLPLKEFRGVLTGVPVYQGQSSDLFRVR